VRANVLLSGKTHVVDMNGEKVTIDGKEFKVNLQKRGEIYLAAVDEMQFGVAIEDGRALVDGVPIELTQGEVSASQDRSRPAVEAAPVATQPRKTSVGSVPGAVVAPMPGKIVTIMVKVGDTVTPGDPILILEAMKMQNEVDSPFTGTVKEVRVREGESVDSNDVMVVIAQ
jgi:biotin carboxyl carrier protein